MSRASIVNDASGVSYAVLSPRYRNGSVPSSNTDSMFSNRNGSIPSSNTSSLLTLPLGMNEYVSKDHPVRIIQYHGSNCSDMSDRGYGCVVRNGDQYLSDGGFGAHTFIAYESNYYNKTHFAHLRRKTSGNNNMDKSIRRTKSLKRERSLKRSNTVSKIPATIAD